MRRSKRAFGPEEERALAAELAAAHRVVVVWMARIPINSPVYTSLTALSAAIHRAADAAAGTTGRLITHQTTPTAPIALADDQDKLRR